MLNFKQFYEAIGIKKYYGVESIFQLLTSFGWSELGSGKFASVWEVPSKEYVVKVWTDDEPYKDFLEYIIKNPNKHFPKVIGRIKSIPAFYKRTNKKEIVHLVKLERLYPIDKEIYRHVETVLHGSMQYRHEYQVEKEIGGKKVMRTAWEYKDLNEIFPQAQSIHDAYFTMMQQIDASPDVKYGNIMQRKDGTIVLIDPVWFDNYYSLANLYAMERQEYDMDAHSDEEPITYTKPHYLEKDTKPETKPETDMEKEDMPF